jgi:alanyl-tRNA synthetase
MPDSPNLLFTNAGMNQFVPIFLGERKADVSKWAGAVPVLDTRAADTQKCIRAGGKHNDLDDVGLDTYHHTFFEMLGNWSFGDYFKQDAIAWAWELVIKKWNFPPERVYATVFCPYIGSEEFKAGRWASDLQRAVAIAQARIAGAEVSFGNLSESDSAINQADREAAAYWAEFFIRAGLDPAIHVVPGSKKDNFWMMGETGPCGPCTEIHVDLRPGPRETSVEEQQSGVLLVNGSDARCIEIWNNVFIQYNANPDGTFSPLPAQHVDTGMGFERVTSIIQGTKGLTDFQHAKISNYETDIFRPIFDELERMSGKKYGSTLPGDDRKAGFQPAPAGQASSLPSNDQPAGWKPAGPGSQDGCPPAEQVQLDIAFRVIADHIRTLSFAIADGISPGNNDRNYVLRRILRRAVRYGRTLGFKEPFFYKLVDVLVCTMGDIFPEIRTKQQHVKDVLKLEEESFNKTLDVGIERFELFTYHNTQLLSYLYRSQWTDEHLEKLIPNLWTDDLFRQRIVSLCKAVLPPSDPRLNHVGTDISSAVNSLKEFRSTEKLAVAADKFLRVFPGDEAFKLYDTFGFPLDLTEVMARENEMPVDKEGFEKLMDDQRARARAAQKKQVIELSQIETKTPTNFLGYDALETSAKVLEVVELKDKTAVILDASVLYAEMGGQVGDTGELSGSGQLWRIVNTQKSSNTFLHFIEGGDAPAVGSSFALRLDAGRRHAIERHHTVTHLLHWALHEVASKEASQKGSSVTPEKLTFDFNSAPLTPAQVADIEKLVNERIVENAGVSWTEVPHADVKNRKDVMQFFGDKYGDVVRVVQIGGKSHALDGYSMELCGGTHTRATGEIGLFRIVSEAAVAAGVRRIEAVAGLSAYALAREQAELIKTLAGKVSAPVAELEKKIDALLSHQKELEKALKAAAQREAAGKAKDLLVRAETINGTPALIANLGEADGDTLQTIADELKGGFQGVIVLGGHSNGAVALIAAVTPEFTAKVQAGKIIQAIAPIVGGKGGGKPDNARGGGKDSSKLDEALAKAKAML